MSSHGLNSAQHKAVYAPAGPLLVLAGAGTGKTRVVLARIAELVHRGTKPERILAVTFTNKAAREMLARCTIGRNKNDARPEISTIHSLSARILRRHASLMGYPERFAIIDRSEQESVARRVLKELKVADVQLRPGDLVDRVSRWKSAAVRPDGALDSAEDDTANLAALGYRRYQQALRTVGAVDFDDLLLVVDELFTMHETARKAEARRFDHLLVDEYQDTSRVQERILASLARDHGSICVVGDDDQAIYGWRGAQVSHILEFASRWKHASTIRLEENYRSTPEIIAAANRLIGCNHSRHGKTLRATLPSGPPPVVMQANDDVDEARRVVSELENRIQIGELEPAEAAILVRTGEQTRVLEQELRRRNVPYELIGSHSFFDRREVRDVMAWLRLLVDPDDDMALSRIVNVPPRGLGQQTLERLLHAASETGKSLWKTMLVARDAHSLSNAAQQGICALEQVLEQAEQAFIQLPPSEVLRRTLETTRYRRHLEDAYEDPLEKISRWAIVEEFCQSLTAFEVERKRISDKKTLARTFLDEMLLEARETERFKQEQLKGKSVRLMTIHAAKGLEFDSVWMVGVEEGLLPHHRALGEDLHGIDEERRLCYVGVTRARKRLCLSLALTRSKWGKKKRCRPSRFLYELTGQPERFVNAELEAAPTTPRVQTSVRSKRSRSRSSSSAKKSTGRS